MTEGKMTVARLPPLSGEHLVPTSPKGGHASDKFHGPTYKINGKIHSLPPPNALKPYVDTKAGALDTWPSHYSSQTLSRTSAMLTHNKHFVLVNEEDIGKPEMVPKPRFLQQLENFLKKELRALNAIEVRPSELRLQAHREVFEYLIEDFKTYRSLLSAIKNEYEMMLSHYRQQIRGNEPLKQMLVTVSEQCDQKVMAIRDEEKKEMTELKAENRRLHDVISSLHNEKHDLVEQVARLKETLEEEYKKYRDECDARKLLVSDINDLRYQQEDYLMSKQNLADDQEIQDDPVTLKIALKKAREDEYAASQRLNEMIANYGDVIPRRDFEALDVKFKELTAKADKLRDDLKHLQFEHTALLEVQKLITNQRDEFYIELQTLKRTATPRPDWSKCAEYISGGTARWNEISAGKRSNQLIDVLLQEISTGGLVEAGGVDYFDGKGTGDNIPPYLRFEGLVRNRRMGKRDCGLMIRDIWREKAFHDAQNPDGKRTSFSIFLYDYLKKHFSLDQLVVEWGYNLYDAIQRYSSDENINLFWKVLSGEADEELYHNILRVIGLLLNSLVRADTESTDHLTHDQMRTQLQQFFYPASIDDIIKMMSCIDEELEISESQDIEYKNLFMEDDEGVTGPFLTYIKNLVKEYRLAYVNKIKDSLGETNPVSVDDLKRAISVANPEADDDLLDRLSTWAFRATIDNLYDMAPAQADGLIERLKYIYIPGSFVPK